jgi:MYXO-CTERM domain-containing protein
MALAGLEMGDPAIAEELKKGEDPNNAPARGGGSLLGSIETPVYGCASAPGAPAPGDALVVAVIIALAGRRRARRRV